MVVLSGFKRSLAQGFLRAYHSRHMRVKRVLTTQTCLEAVQSGEMGVAEERQIYMKRQRKRDGLSEVCIDGGGCWE